MPPGWVHTNNPFVFQMLKSKTKYCHNKQRNREKVLFQKARNSYLPQIPYALFRRPKPRKFAQNNPSRNNLNQPAKVLVAIGFRRIELIEFETFSFKFTSPDLLKGSSESYPAQAVTGGRDPYLQDKN